MGLVDKIIMESQIDEVTLQKMRKYRRPEFFYIKGQAQEMATRNGYTLLHSNDAYYVTTEKGEVAVYFQLKQENIDGIKLPKVEFITTNDKHKGTGMLGYEFMLSLYPGIWSDERHSPGGQKMWGKLADRYYVFAYDMKTKKFYDVEESGGLPQAVDPSVKVYGSSSIRLCCFRMTPDYVKNNKSTNAKVGTTVNI